MSVRRWMDVLRHRLSVPDGSAGGGAEPEGAGRDPPLVHHEAAERLPRAPQQTRGYLLLLLGGSHTEGNGDSHPCLEIHRFTTFTQTFDIKKEQNKNLGKCSVSAQFSLSFFCCKYRKLFKTPLLL